MINGGYLIPANTKRGELIFGVFTLPDLMLFIIGIFISLVLIFTLGTDETLNAIISLLPAVIAGFLVAIPIANYRNVLTFIKSMISFYTNQRNYKWKGWCYRGQTRK